MHKFKLGDHFKPLPGVSPIEAYTEKGDERVFCVTNKKLINCQSIPDYYRISGACVDGSTIEGSEHLFQIVE